MSPGAVFAAVFCAVALLSDGARAGQPLSPPVVKVGVVRYTTPAPYNPIIESTLHTIHASLEPDYAVEVAILPREDLEKAVIDGAVDIFLSSAGFYRRLILYGAKDLATAMSPRYPDPNHSEGAAIVVLNRSAGMQTIDALRGTTVAVPSRFAFSGFQIPMGEIARRGYDWRRFFSNIVEVGDGDQAIHVFDALLEGRVTAAFAKQCVLEEYVRMHPDAGRALRVLEPMQTGGECVRSTNLYPTWTLGSSFAAPPEVSRRVTSAVLRMPATDGGLQWGVATDFSMVDRLLKDLRIGPYEYLNEWTLTRFVDRFWPVMLAALMLVAGLIWHSIRVGQLVQIRTKELQKALAEQKQLQQQAMEANRKLNAAQKIGVISQVSTILAHELRQPVGAISCYLDGLKAILNRPGLSPKAAEAIDRIEAQIDRIEAIMQKVRAYRKNPGGLNQRIAMSDIVRHAVDTVRQSFADAGVVIESDIEPGVEVRGDALEIGLLTINLVKNAAEAAGQVKNGTVTVRLTNLVDSVQLTVADNGPLHTQEELKSVTSRLESTKEDGLGLGLQIVGGIAERHRAVLRFGLRPGSGLIVVAVFPPAEKSKK